MDGAFCLMRFFVSVLFIVCLSPSRFCSFSLLSAITPCRFHYFGCYFISSLFLPIPFFEFSVISCAPLLISFSFVSLARNLFCLKLLPAILSPSDWEIFLKQERVYVTLMRDHTGLGFSIAGGKGGDPYKDGTDVRVTEID